MTVPASAVPANLRAALENSANSFDEDLSEDITYIKTQTDEENNGSTLLQLKQDGDRDWNQEFQQIREREFHNRGSNSLQDIYLAESQRVIELKKLIQEFAVAAKSIGTVIITELFLPYDQKTIKPVTKSVGGIAGGEKYVHRGIFFKFAIDERGLYNGDEYIMKSAAHEFHSLMELLDTRVKGLCFPLMVLIDYLGYRLVAQSILPVGKDTLVWGTSDGAGSLATVSDNSQAAEFESKLAKVANILNLQPHYVSNWSRSQRCKMYTPIDCEWHLGTDGRFYCVDSARLFPPATPVKGIKGGHLYRLLRPELVRNWKVPLCSDSFSGFYLEESEKKNYENAITEATNHLEKNVIPNFATFLDQLYSSTYDTIGEQHLSSHRIDITKMPTPPIHSVHYNQKVFEEFTKLIASLHRKGINIRYLGALRSYSTDPKVRALLLTEIVARTVKNTIRGHMRALKSPQLKEYLKLVVNYLNLLFGSKPKTEEYWKMKLKTNVLKRYEQAFFEDELLNEFDVRHAIYSIPLLFRLMQYFSITLQESVFKNMVISMNMSSSVDSRFTDHQRDNNKSSSYTLVFSRKVKMTDFVSFMPVVKYFHRVELEEGMALARQASMETSGENSEQLLKLAEQKYEAALQIKPDDYRALCNWGQSLQTRGVREISLGSSDKAIQLFKQSSEKYSHAVEIDNKYFQAWLHWGTLLAAWSAVKDANESLELLQEACAKYESAEKVQSNQAGLDRLYYNWGMALLFIANSNITSMKKASKNPYVNSIEARTALESSCKKLEISLKSQPNQPKALKLYALAVLKLARFHTDSSQMLEKLNLAAEKFMECSELQFHDHIQDPEVYFHWGNVLFKISKLKKQQDGSGKNSLECFNTLNLCIDKYSFALMLKPDYCEAIENLGKAFVARLQLNKSLNSVKSVTMSLEMYIEALKCFVVKSSELEKFNTSWLGPIQLLLPASNSQIILRKLEDLRDVLKKNSSQEENSISALIQTLNMLISTSPPSESEFVQPSYATYHSSSIGSDVLAALRNNNNNNNVPESPPRSASTPVMDDQVKLNIMKLMTQYKGKLAVSDTINFDNSDLSENIHRQIQHQTLEIHGFTMVDAEPLMPSLRSSSPAPLRPVEDDAASSSPVVTREVQPKPPAQGYLDD